ncbi:YcnI family protein [Corticibacterium sp. UT-5YL-CI-8]|nr:YcnI family protein [Tianweitania sp. UT-5YL-CI-8]
MKAILHGALLGAALLIPSIASAHITFEAKEVTAGGTQKFVLRVPHGCAGSPTNEVRIQIPAELSGVKPQPKPGWTLSIDHAEHEAVATPASTAAHAGHDTPVREIAWSGGSLQDAHYDEFVFRAKVDATAAGKDLFIPIVQKCETGIERWIELPGANGAEPQSPAPSVKVVPGA